MNYLGIDFGEKKIGLSKASSELPIATPFKVMVNGGRVLNVLADIVRAENISEIIVGYPLSLSGKAGAQTKVVDGFIKQLSVLGKPIHKQDERFSTRASVATGQDDASAAAIILQAYLDSRNKK